MSVCPVCGKTFEPKRGAKFGSRFCSMKCYQADWYQRKTADVKKTCPICGKVYHPDSGHRQYCSDECKEEARIRQRKIYKQRDYNKKGHATGEVFDRVCGVCGKAFTTKIKRQRFCCKKCQKTNDNLARNAKRASLRVVITKTCVWCGKEFTTNRAYNKTCSPHCSKMRYNHQCSQAEYERKLEERIKAALIRNEEKKLDSVVRGLSKAQMMAVIDAQDGDPSLLWKLSQNWTPAMHKFAKARYESVHGLWSQTYYG